jgi:hypothetical protein
VRALNSLVHLHSLGTEHHAPTLLCQMLAATACQEVLKAQPGRTTVLVQGFFYPILSPTPCLTPKLGENAARSCGGLWGDGEAPCSKPTNRLRLVPRAAHLSELSLRYVASKCLRSMTMKKKEKGGRKTY